MRYLKEIVKYFTCITTGIVILFIVLCFIKKDIDGVSTATLAEIPAAGLLTSIVTVVLYPSEEKPAKGFKIQVLIHYAVLCAVMSITGVLFGWIDFNIFDILLMCVSTAAVYAFTYAVTYISSMQDADELNRALKDKNAR